ncbi:FIST signal transduction protein [Magnetospira sp. QH-2]|uniref:FIST signal transduction protein n=1 Tax=Magnetospira sp. (strain QH-2) TaxID=1288970 RepID=UPI0003E81770|nr:FIST N-terminal domain-containing protein [Magnetospira sp. QH-2]CCQ72862.1 conserved protein of unknown function [Magnetospira sp. QH-2]
MGTHAGIGTSRHRYYKTAASEAVQQALTNASIDKPDVALVFASASHPQQDLIREIRSLLDQAPLIGCSGNGLIAPGMADEGNFFVGVMVITSDDLRFDVAQAQGLDRSAQGVGQTIGQLLKPCVAEDSLCLIALGDGLNFNFDRFQSGLAQHVSLPVFGGLAGDGWHMKGTTQYCNGEVFENGISCLLMSGQGRLATAVHHGCMPIGEERTITKAEGNVIHEIDGIPTVKVLEEYMNPEEMGDWGRAVVNLSLGFKAPDAMKDYDEYLVRFMPQRDPETGSVTVATETEPGTGVWMSRRDKNKIIDGVRQIATDVTNQLSGSKPKFVLHFDCAGRGKMILREQEKINVINDLQENVAPGSPWFGFYTHGEIAPVAGTTCFHNYSLVLLAVY